MTETPGGWATRPDDAPDIDMPSPFAIQSMPVAGPGQRHPRHIKGLPDKPRGDVDEEGMTGHWDPA